MYYRFLSVVIALSAGVSTTTAGQWDIYVGTYTGGDSEGVYRLEFDDKTGTTSLAGLAGEAENPNFLALHPSEPVLYAVCRMEGGDAVAAYRIAEDTGDLTLLNKQPAEGKGPCHVSVTPDGEVAAIANYSDGTVTIYPLGANGTLGAKNAFYQHEGSGPDERRQTGPHAHSATIDAEGKHLIIADLGIDKLMIYKRDGDSFAPNDPAFATTPPGGGPRHFAFHPTKPFAYTNNEMGNSVTAFHWDADTGSLNTIHTLSTLPEDFTEDNTTADIEVHPSGKFLYTSNRGHDSIAVYGIDEASGELTAQGQTKTGGKRPRNFAVDPTGNFLLAANQDTHDIFVFSIDQETGALTPTGQRIEVASPVCLVFRKK